MNPSYGPTSVFFNNNQTSPSTTAGSLSYAAICLRVLDFLAVTPSPAQWVPLSVLHSDPSLATILVTSPSNLLPDAIRTSPDLELSVDATLVRVRKKKNDRVAGRAAEPSSIVEEERAEPESSVDVKMEDALDTSKRYKLGEQLRSHFEHCIFHQNDGILKEDPQIIWRDDEIEGKSTWYSIESIAAMKKVREIPKDMDLLREALRRSDKLEMDPSGEYVRSLTVLVRNVKSYRTVYAVGFPLDITRDDLEGFFLHFGKIERITLRLPESSAQRGAVALVEFEDEKDAAKCVQTASRLYKGVRLTIALRQPKDIKARPKVKQDPQRTLYVAGFPRDTAEEDVQRYFEDYGAVSSVNAIRPAAGLNNKRLAAFVEFTTIAELARAASQPHSYDGNPLLIQSRNTSITIYIKPQTRLHPTHLSNTILHFSGVDPVTTTEDILFKVFAKYATISRVHYRRDDTSGYIHLKESVAAEVAAKLQETDLRIGVETITVRSLQDEEESMYIQCLQRSQADSSMPGKRPHQQKGGSKKRARSFANKKTDHIATTNGAEVLNPGIQVEGESKPSKKMKKKNKAQFARKEKIVLKQLGELTVCPDSEKDQQEPAPCKLEQIPPHQCTSLSSTIADGAKMMVEENSTSFANPFTAWMINPATPATKLEGPTQVPTPPSTSPDKSTGSATVATSWWER